MKLFDAHAHMADYKSDQIDKIIKNAERNGVWLLNLNRIEIYIDG